MTEREQGNNSNLDFMRACAVLCVVGFHLMLLFQVAVPGPFAFHSIGHWGVLVFFVHTTLVLNLSMSRQARRGQATGLFWPFLTQRVFRIYPLSVLTVLVVVVAKLPVGHIEHGQFLPAQLGFTGVLANIFLVQNLTGSESAVVPMWSLPYEMQMYLLLPALFLLARRTRTFLPLVLVWAVAMVPLLRPWYFQRHGIPDFVDYLAFFVPGVVAFKMMSGHEARLPAALWPFALVALTLTFLEHPSGAWAGVCCLLLGIAIPQFKEMSHPLVCRLSRDIARYSYGIYLMHFICMWWAFQGLENRSNPFRWTLFAISVCVIPVALYHLVEAPMIRLGRRIAGARSVSDRSALLPVLVDHSVVEEG